MLSSYEMYEGVLAFLIGAGIFSCLSMVMFKMRSVIIAGFVSPPRLPVIGVAGGCAAVLCFQRWGMNCRGIIAYIFLCILMMTAYVDGKTMKIPNEFVIATAAAGVASIPFFPEITLEQRGIGILCISIPLLAIALLIPGGIGGGDIKFMAASGLFLGWKGTIKAFVVAILLAGIYCIGMMAVRKINRKSRIALGPFLCLGIAVVVFTT